jgi:prepilin-type N-terminal cleavage/methylation domain-containing protein
LRYRGNQMTLNRKYQKGLSLIEIMVALSVAAATTAGLAHFTSQYADDTRTQGIAHHMKQVGNAAADYISDHHATLAGIATSSTPALITVDALITEGFLPGGFSASNAQGHDVCVLVLQPSTGVFEGLVVAETPSSQPDLGLDDASLGLAAATIGAAGGGIYSGAPTTLQGAMGSWSTPVGNFANAPTRCDGTTGSVALKEGHPVMALWFEQNADATGFVYRDAVPGRPELNRMNTTLDMGGNQLTGLATATEGNACTGLADGTLGTTSTGRVLSCQGGNWELQGSKYWRDPVNNFASLGACGANEQGMTRVARNGNESGGSNRARAYTCSGGSWRPHGLDQNGTLNAPTDVIAGRDLNAGRNLSAGQDATIGRDLQVNRNSRVNGNEYVVGGSDVGSQTVRGNQTVSGRANINELGGNLRVQTIATENTACSPNGKIARTNTGLLLSCQSGSWKQATGAGGIGVRSIFKPLAGNSITVSYENKTQCQARIAADGAPQFYGAISCTGGLFNKVCTYGWKNALAIEAVGDGICTLTTTGLTYYRDAYTNISGHYFPEVNQLYTWPIN